MAWYAFQSARLCHKFPHEFLELSPFDKALTIAAITPTLEMEARIEKEREEREVGR